MCWSGIGFICRGWIRERFGVTEEQLRAGRVTEGFRELVRLEVERTEAMFDEGAGLLPLLKPMYRKQIALFLKGGRAVCGAVRRQGFDTLTKRPRLSGWQKMRLIGGTLVGYLAGKLVRGTDEMPVEGSSSVTAGGGRATFTKPATFTGSATLNVPLVTQKKNGDRGGAA